MLFVLFCEVFSANQVTIGSAIQLKGVFTKNRLTVTDIETSSIPYVYSSRPPYKDTWYWRLGLDNYSQCAERQPILCGDQITLQSIYTEFYLSVLSTPSKVDVVPQQHKLSANTWTVKCDTVSWEQDQPVQLFNEESQCFLYSGFQKRTGQFDQNAQYYINCTQNQPPETFWRAVEGIYVDAQPLADYLHNDEL